MIWWIRIKKVVLMTVSLICAGIALSQLVPDDIAQRVVQNREAFMIGLLLTGMLSLVISLLMSTPKLRIEKYPVQESEVQQLAEEKSGHEISPGNRQLLEIMKRTTIDFDDFRKKGKYIGLLGVVLYLWLLEADHLMAAVAHQYFNGLIMALNLFVLLAFVLIVYTKGGKIFDGIVILPESIFPKHIRMRIQVSDDGEHEFIQVPVPSPKKRLFEGLGLITVLVLLPALFNEFLPTWDFNENIYWMFLGSLAITVVARLWLGKKINKALWAANALLITIALPMIMIWQQHVGPTAVTDSRWTGWEYLRYAIFAVVVLALYYKLMGVFEFGKDKHPADEHGQAPAAAAPAHNHHGGIGSKIFGLLINQYTIGAAVLVALLYFGTSLHATNNAHQRIHDSFSKGVAQPTISWWDKLWGIDKTPPPNNGGVTVTPPPSPNTGTLGAHGAPTGPDESDATVFNQGPCAGYIRDNFSGVEDNDIHHRTLLPGRPDNRYDLGVVVNPGDYVQICYQGGDPQDYKKLTALKFAAASDLGKFQPWYFSYQPQRYFEIPSADDLRAYTQGGSAGPFPLTLETQPGTAITQPLTVVYIVNSADQ